MIKIKEIDIAPEEFVLLPLEEQTKIFKNLIMDLSKEELRILKIMVDNEEENRA